MGEQQLRLRLPECPRQKRCSRGEPWATDLRHHFANLVGKYLRRGAMVDGLVSPSVDGTPQGGPLSPLLANIYLDALDKELDRRGHSHCRYADDCKIYVSSEAAAERKLASIQGWIEKPLRLKVNAAKSGTGRGWERK